ncbi:hypothetical protein PanWU01x14_221680 [Parasponia andersonii]|uniref:Uncharacterized protein n=1 Tax=Parasponia andersonii TaxID=3476 RepID=A0A2P5BPB9_PARAD|nr:hypothetical protein PanWU01x14_221680 [Parasponia andersonii]
MESSNLVRLRSGRLSSSVIIVTYDDHLITLDEICCLSALSGTPSHFNFLVWEISRDNQKQKDYSYNTIKGSSDSAQLAQVKAQHSAYLIIARVCCKSLN